MKALRFFEQSVSGELSNTFWCSKMTFACTRITRITRSPMLSPITPSAQEPTCAMLAKLRAWNVESFGLGTQWLTLCRDNCRDQGGWESKKHSRSNVAMQKSLTVVVVSMILTLRPWLRDNKLQMYIYILIRKHCSTNSGIAILWPTVIKREDTFNHYMPRHVLIIKFCQSDCLHPP